jgi:dTDP-glucose pyrophosphorylase
MNLFVLAAGEGTRFKNYSKLPKPLLSFNDDFFFTHSAQSGLRNLDVTNLFFVILSSHKIKYNLDKTIRDKFPYSKIVIIEDITSGPAETAEKALHNLDNNLPIGFVDCDLIFDLYKPVSEKLFCQYDAGLILFKSSNPKYSYAEVVNRGVKSTAEKKLISNNAIGGCYMFKNKSLYLHYYKILKNTEHNSELYLSMIYNLLIKDRRKIFYRKIKKHVSIGTPEELHEAIVSG